MTEPEWQNRLTLYDEPHGSEYFVLDNTYSPPVWYKLDGTLCHAEDEPRRRPSAEMVAAIAQHGWTPRLLFPHPPARLESTVAANTGHVPGTRDEGNRR